MNFEQQAEKFMVQIANRKRNPVREATLMAYRSLLNKWILPALGSLPLADVQNGTVKSLVDTLAKAGISAQTTTSVVGLVKAVLKSATDANGNQLYPRTWNNEFMDVPTIQHGDQKAPTITLKTLQSAISRSSGQFRALIALLAGSGLRIGEALALKVGRDNGRDSYWVPETGTLIIRSTVSKGAIQYAPKTEAGNREIDIHPDLNAFLKQALPVEDGLMFRGENDGLFRSNSTHLYNALKNAGIPGFHSLRRFRLTFLDAAGASRGMIKAWAGHADSDITDRYIDSSVNAEARKAAAASYGFGFQLEVA